MFYFVVFKGRIIMRLKHLYFSISQIFNFYKEGFKNLTLGKTLWKIIFIKLFVFDVNFNSIFKSDKEKSTFVLKNLTLEGK
ncbi:membrane protein [Campylobacter jejuni subsp. doylei]|nr:membrane protein [Campylobacter jejuni subsp. doylei]